MSYYYPQQNFGPMPTMQHITPTPRVVQPGMDSRPVPNPRVMSRIPSYKEYVATNNYNNNDWKRNRTNKQVPYPHRPIPVPAYALPPIRLQSQTYQNNNKITTKRPQYHTDETESAEEWDDRRTISPIPITNRLFELQTPPRLPVTTNRPIGHIQNPWNWNHPMKHPAMMGVPPPMTQPTYHRNPAIEAVHNPQQRTQPPLYHRSSTTATAAVYPSVQIPPYKPMLPLAHHFRTNPYLPQYVQQPAQQSQYAFQPVAPPMMPPPYQHQMMQQELRRPVNVKASYPEEYQKQPFDLQKKVTQTTHWNATDMKLNFGI